MFESIEKEIENLEVVLDAKKEDILNRINELNEEIELYEEDDVSELISEKTELEKELRQLNMLDPYKIDTDRCE